MQTEDVKKYFEIPQVVDEYTRAAANVGLWESEKKLFEKYFDKSSAILELGCGAGRIAHSLYKRGFEDIHAIDISNSMIAAAQEISFCLGDKVKYECADATKIKLKKNYYGGAIFGFNGLMQIPKRAQRKAVIKNIFNALKDGGHLIFTTHDRFEERHQKYWDEQKMLWKNNAQDPLVDEFGDSYYQAEHGKIFIHSPSRSEIISDIIYAGFELVFHDKRSAIALEPEQVREFSDDCIFWVAAKNLEKLA